MAKPNIFPIEANKIDAYSIEDIKRIRSQRLSVVGLKDKYIHCCQICRELHEVAPDDHRTDTQYKG